MKVRSVVLLVALAATVGVAVPASAIPLYLTPPTSSFVSGGPGGTRGDIVTTSASFNLASIGIEVMIDRGQTLTFNAYVWSSEDRIGIAPLATGALMPVTGDGTLRFYDLPIAYTLAPGQEYDIGISFNSFNSIYLDVHYYEFAYPQTPFTVNPITVYDGEQSYNGPGNFLTPHLRLNGETGPPVPEPGSMLLLGTGLVGLGRAWRKRRQ